MKQKALIQPGAKVSDPSAYVLLYMLDCVAAASFHIRPMDADDEDVVATQR